MMHFGMAADLSYNLQIQILPPAQLNSYKFFFLLAFKNDSDSCLTVFARIYHGSIFAACVYLLQKSMYILAQM